MIAIERVGDHYKVTKDNVSKTFETLKEAAEWAEGSNDDIQNQTSKRS